MQDLSRFQSAVCCRSKHFELQSPDREPTSTITEKLILTSASADPPGPAPKTPPAMIFNLQTLIPGVSPGVFCAWRLRSAITLKSHVPSHHNTQETGGQNSAKVMILLEVRMVIQKVSCPDVWKGTEGQCSG